MISFTGHAYLITCKSNLHAGSGDNNYAVIDKEVQRDTITREPVIHASGIKGALREYFDEYVGWKKNAPEKTAAIFGSGKDTSDKLQQGEFRFFEARLLSIPVRGRGDEAYYNATSESLIAAYNQMAEALGITARIKLPAAAAGQAQTEYGNAPLYGNLEPLGERVAVLTPGQMNNLLKDLPLIARNSLNNGQSENLWYEEVVPRESRFSLFMAVPENTEAGYVFKDDFNAHLNGKSLQIGANATVGYGFCHFKKLN